MSTSNYWRNKVTNQVIAIAIVIEIVSRMSLKIVLKEAAFVNTKKSCGSSVISTVPKT